MSEPAGNWRRVPLQWSVDLQHGGRWTSLRTTDREWLWTNPDRRTATQRIQGNTAPDRAFIDAGGGEECWPTVRGEPDHGAAWSRAWSGHPEESEVTVAGTGALRRRIGGSDTIKIDYEVAGTPGSGFLHAVHLLLDVGTEARLVVPGTPRMRVLDSDRVDRQWPDGLDRLGPDDSTAICALLTDTTSAIVVDGRHALRLRWSSADQPEHCGLLLWRNLQGWPEEQPYRSIGIEPMLGRSADRKAAADDELARIGPTGRTRWTLELEALAERSDAPA